MLSIKTELVELGIDSIKRNNDWEYCGKDKYYVFVDVEGVKHSFTKRYVLWYGQQHLNSIRRFYNE